MKIAYLAYWDVSRESGVLKKVARQMREWIRLGHEVRLFAASPGRGTWSGIADLDVETAGSSRTLTNLWVTPGLTRRVRAWWPDLVYHRFHFWYPGLGGLMEAVSTVVEINGDDVAQCRTTQPWYETCYHVLTRPRVMARAKGFVTITHELTAGLHACGKPVEVVADSIELADYPVTPAPENVRPRLVSIVAHPANPWVGFDKLLWLADRFPGWDFDLVGPDKDQFGAGVPPNVKVHGYLGRDRYDPILACADIAVGSLALHRIGMNESSSLKTREYLAFGLPVVVGYRDTDFPGPADFLLELPNAEDNVAANVERIERFVLSWKGRRIPRESVRHLDVRVKEERRLAFFGQIVAPGR